MNSVNDLSKGIRNHWAHHAVLSLCCDKRSRKILFVFTDSPCWVPIRQRRISIDSLSEHPCRSWYADCIVFWGVEDKKDHWELLLATHSLDLDYSSMLQRAWRINAWTKVLVCVLDDATSQRSAVRNIRFRKGLSRLSETDCVSSQALSDEPGVYFGSTTRNFPPNPWNNISYLQIQWGNSISQFLSVFEKTNDRIKRTAYLNRMAAVCSAV